MTTTASGRVDERAILMVNVIDTISVQNSLAPFCCVNRKALYGTFLCLAILASSSTFSPISNKKKKTNKKISIRHQ